MELHGMTFWNLEPAHYKLLTEKPYVTDLKQLSLELYSHASRLMWLLLTQFPLQTPQKEISFRDVGNRLVTTFLILLTELEID